MTADESKIKPIGNTRDDIKTRILNASDLELELVWIPAIMHRQTDSELKEKQTICKNKSGVSSVDAPLLTEIYNKILSGSHISPQESHLCRVILPKYHKQYINIKKQKLSTTL